MAGLFSRGNNVPPGTVISFGGTTAPIGWLLCDGTSYLRSLYPALFQAVSTAFGTASGTTFNVPDLRGRFLRGVDGTAGLDPDKVARTVMLAGGNAGNLVGSVQPHAFTNHTHTVPIATASAAVPSSVAIGGNPTPNSTQTSNGASVGSGNETRPVNAYVNFLIKI